MNTHLIRARNPFAPLILGSLLWLLTLSAAQAQRDATLAKHANLDDGLAIQGYDPVAYFTVKKATKGQKTISTQYQGATYRFASVANRDRFLKAPGSYAPAYGGWCAYAMGESGEKVEIDPETFEVRDGRLYLFYHTFFNNTLPKWQKDETNLQRKADQNWQKLLSN
ncbi:YHS domain-containing (seleno)protein [Larkinella sp. C7]|jgi:YHS domain-containing protein|uniref:YHS domain-containing (seleno)protein n=1 Tax=Larkinella sp. C7 TaxID=2576607 RepID=UPI00111151BF|nr:YHS domain-containing (seleno)protein [Larkinella sp. C7]